MDSVELRACEAIPPVARPAIHPRPLRCLPLKYPPVFPRVGASWARRLTDLARSGIDSQALSRTWTASATLRIRWKAVSDPCGPVTYTVYVERRPFARGASWALVWGERGLSTTDVTLPWPVNGWGRYRVVAVDGNGNRSGPARWRYFRFAGPDLPKRDRLVVPPVP